MKISRIFPDMLLPVCLLLHAVTVWAHSDSTVHVIAEARASATADAPEFRTFENLAVSSEGSSSHDIITAPDAVIADSVLDKRNHAHAVLEKVLQSQRFLESLDALSEIELPVGIVKSGGALDYSILVDRIQFTKEGALMDVYVSLALPQTGSRIAFHGVVPLQADGGIGGNAKVFLLGDHAIPLHGNTLVTLKGWDRTYVEFDCSGFLGIQLDAEIEFSRDLLLPEDASGAIQEGRLKANVTTYTESLHDILLSVTLPPFQLPGLAGFGFQVKEAYLDWSDSSNPVAMAFPAGYVSPFVKAGLDELWQGIYLQEADVRLPPAFAKRESSGRISIGAKEMILDHLGMTGSLYVENVFSDGDMQGWGYTLDKLSLELITSSVSGFSLEGLLAIPVVNGPDGKSAQFGYVAHRGAEGNYIFSVAIQDSLRLDLWAADINLHKGSSVIVTEKNDTFYPSAHLNGELTINLLGKGPRASFNSIRFEAMVIDSEAPYFRPGTFGLGREGQQGSLSKFPVVFDNITLKSEDRRAGIAFDLTVNISGKPEDGAFSGKGGLVVWGIQDDEPRKDVNGQVISLDRYSWRYDKTELTSLKIDIKIPKVIELSGAVRFFDEDKTYGDGFKGSLKGKINSISMQAEALFGKTETFRYWYADALVELKSGVPIVPGVLSAFGFGGGYYSKMKQGVSKGSVALGRPPSGITYIPDEKTVGIRAIVLIGTPRPEAMRGDVSLEVSINRHGGINSVTLAGNANFMSADTPGKDQVRQLAAAAVSGTLTEKLGSLKRGQVYGSVRLHFDNVNDVFHGNLEVYVNVAGGIVRGVSDGNKAGWAVLHFEKNDWYIHIGTPDQPLGLEVARIFKSKSYFMLGKNLPGSPPPPPQVSEILGNVDLDYMRDMNALESGMGIAFGLHFLVDTGDLRFLMFYGRFSAGTGLDFMLKDYGNEYHCAGSSGPMGINGWYANGQAYAFVMGKIGVKVNLKFYKGTYDILSIGAAAILQAKGPNPFWMKGTVGGYYKILGGLVKGKCRFEVTVGKECKPAGEQNLLEEVNMIAQISPAPNSREIDVFNTPQLAFNISVGEVFAITDLEHRNHLFRAVLDEFQVFDNGTPIPGEQVWNAERNVVLFDAEDILPERKKLKVRAKLTFEKRINGVWSKVRFDGKVVTETAETQFETGDAPANIPAGNVLNSYPLAGQVNFFPEEHASGYIQLKDGQPYLFRHEKNWVQRVRWTEMSSGRGSMSPITYDQQKRRILFPIPEHLENAQGYMLEIVNVPRESSGPDHNVHEVETKIQIDASAGDAVLTTQSIEGEVSSLELKTLYRSHFRTSRHDTFAEKMRNTIVRPALRLMQGTLAYRLEAPLAGDEGFGEEEIYGTAFSDRLIVAEAITENNHWFNAYVYPVVYEGYPLMGWMSVSRATAAKNGVPPIRDVFMGSHSPQWTFTGSQGPGFSFPMQREYISYNLGESVVSDFRDLQRQAVNYVVDNPGGMNPRMETLIMSPIPYIRQGVYSVRLSYTLPGINLKTSSYDISIFNPTPDND